MQTRIYRFEVLKGISNAVFQARDTVNEETVNLYEWTPPLSAREESRQKFDQLSDQLQCEAFTVDVSLYLAAKSEVEANHDLVLLRTAGLFSGSWPTDPPPVPPPTPTVPKLSTMPEPVRMGVSGGKVFAMVLIFALLALFIGMGIGASNGRQSGDNAVQRAKQDADGKVQALQSQLNDASSSLRDAQYRLQQYQQIHPLYIKNGCGYPMSLAVTTETFDDHWITFGWSHLKVGETRLVAVSSIEDFYIHADAGIYSWPDPKNATSYKMDVLNDKFASIEGQAQFQADKTVDTLKLRANSNSDPMVLSCS